MAQKVVEIVLVLVLVLMAMLQNRATAQSGCTSALVGLSPCLNYVTGNSSTPSSSCCSSLSGVVKSQPQCLCLLLNGGGSSLGVSVNQTLALALPGACKVQTPDVSKCNAGNGPTSLPTSPTHSSNGTPETPATPSGGGSKTTPSTTGSSSGGNVVKTSPHLVAFVILVVSSVLIVTGF